MKFEKRNIKIFRLVRKIAKSDY